MEPTLTQLVSDLKAFEIRTFKEAERSIERCFHIPHSGWGNPSYATIKDYLEESATQLILSCIENYEPSTLQELQESLEPLEEEGEIHWAVEQDLTWQGHARESLIILDEYEDFLETDSGLWEKITDAREILRIQAFFTYKNALRHRIHQKVDQALWDAQEESVA